jgi:hypothetical protein
MHILAVSAFDPFMVEGKYASPNLTMEICASMSKGSIVGNLIPALIKRVFNVFNVFKVMGTNLCQKEYIDKAVNTGVFARVPLLAGSIWV